MYSPLSSAKSQLRTTSAQNSDSPIPLVRPDCAIDSKIEVRWSFTVVSSVACLVALRVAASTDILVLWQPRESFRNECSELPFAKPQVVFGPLPQQSLTAPACAADLPATRSLGLLQEDF